TREFSRIPVGRERLRLAMSVGIHSGRFWSASAGLAGVRLQHFFCGPDVARVAAVQGSATAGEIFITPDAAEKVPGLVPGEDRDGYLKVVRLKRQPPATPVQPLVTVDHPERLAPFLPPYVEASL